MGCLSPFIGRHVTCGSAKLDCRTNVVGRDTALISDPSRTVLQDGRGYTVVWHIKPGIQNCEFERYVKKSDAEAWFRDFLNGPYNTILFDEAGKT